ncbi:unnamed protein product [Lota lota]
MYTWVTFIDSAAAVTIAVSFVLRSLLCVSMEVQIHHRRALRLTICLQAKYSWCKLPIELRLQLTVLQVSGALLLLLVLVKTIRKRMMMMVVVVVTPAARLQHAESPRCKKQARSTQWLSGKSRLTN